MKLLRQFGCIVLLFTLVSCGGGDGSLSRDDNDGGGNGGGDGGNATYSVTLSKTDGNVSVDNSLIITAAVTNNGDALSGELVTFIINNPDLANFSPAIGTATTSVDGNASIILNSGSVDGAGFITATLNSDSDISDSITFTSDGDGDIGGEVNVSALDLLASSQQIASSGSQNIDLIAIAKDNNNNLLEGVNVTFSADSGQIQLINAITGADGKANAILRTDNEPSNRAITVTAMSDQVNDDIVIQVLGTTVQLTGSSSLAINDNNNYIVKLLDSDGNGIANEEIIFLLSNESSNGNIASLSIPDSVTTDFSGQASIVISGSSGGNNTIIASALGATVNKEVSVQADSFLFTNFNNGNGININPSVNPTFDIVDVFLSDSASLTLTWLRNGVPVADGTVVNFTSTRGVVSTSSATIIDGTVAVSINSLDAGRATVTFTGSDGTVELNNQFEFEFVAEDADSIVAQASPNSLGPNGQQSTVSVVVKDVNFNLVKNKIIDFTLTDSNGGVIFPASAVTDSNGSASTVYTSNAVSAFEGISIKGTVRDTPSQNDTVNLTVSERSVFISLGTGNNIIEEDITTYNKQYSVFVTDIDSNPVENAELTISAIPNTYYKGRWFRLYDDEDNFIVWGAQGETIIDPKFPCLNEDENLNGILDLGEDTNSDSVLTPGNIVGALGSVTTDIQGRAVIDILYAKSFGLWVDVDLILSTRVNGTESSRKATFTLPVSANDINKEDETPPTAGVGLDGPFGVLANCAVTD
jgi:hypothetical protein